MSMYIRTIFKQDGMTVLYKDLVAIFPYKAGDTIDIIQRPCEKERRAKQRTVKVLQVFKEHVLLDFGHYKECRKKSDIMLHLCHVRED